MKDTGKQSARERYEKMLAGKSCAYFEAGEIEDIADSYEDEKAYRKALKAVAYGLELYPMNDTLLLRKVLYLLLLNRVEEAGRTLGQVTDHSIDYYLLKGRLCLARDHADDAVKCFMHVVADPDCYMEDYIEILDVAFDYCHEEIIPELLPAMESHADDMTLFYRELAFAYERQDNVEDAVVYFNKVLDLNPYSTDDWAELAKAYFMLRLYDKAIEACDFALAIDDKDENILAFKGLCYFHNRQYDEAVSLYKEFARITSDKELAFKSIAEIYTRMGRHNDAIDYFKRAIALDGNNSGLYYQLAINYYCLGDNDTAMDTLYTAVGCNNDDMDAHLLLGEMLWVKGDTAAAYEHLSVLKSTDITNIGAAKAFADTCMHLERYDEALPFLRKIVEAEPYNPTIIFDLIYACIETGDEAAALQHLSLADKIAHDDVLLDKLDADTKDAWLGLRRHIATLRSMLGKMLDEDL